MKPPFPTNVNVPNICAWCISMSKHVQAVGMPLNAVQMQDSRMVGVIHPERIRVLVVDEMPYPDDLREWCEWVYSEGAPGMSLGDSILLNRRTGMSRRTLAHELVHTAQYHRTGGRMKGYVYQYLEEISTVGYLMAPMEIEARNLSTRVPARYPT